MAGDRIQASLAAAFEKVRMDRREIVPMFASLGLRMAGLLCTFGLGVVLARSWNPAQFGIYGLVISVAALATTVCQLGTPQLAVREFAVLANQLAFPTIRRISRTFQLVALGASLIVVAIAAGMMLAGWPLLNVDPVFWLIGALFNVFAVQIVVISAALRGAGDITKGQFMEVFGRPFAVLGGCGVAWLALGNLTIGSVLLIQLLVAIGAAMLCQFWLFRATATGLETVATPRKHWVRSAVPLGVIDVLRQLDGVYGLVLLGWLAQGDDLGWFRVALACGAIINVPISIIHVVLAPRVAVLFNSDDRTVLQALLDRVSLQMTLISALVVVVIALIGEAGIILAFGSAYAGAWLPLLIISLAQLVFSLFGMGPILLIMAGQERRLTITYIAAIASGIAAAAILIPLYGAMGSALAQLVSLSLIAVLSGVIARTRLGLRTCWLDRFLTAAGRSND